MSTARRQKKRALLMTEEQGTTAIYGLVSPVTGKIQYVGKSQNPRSRLKRHLYIAQSSKYHQNNALYRWLRKLRQQELEPNLIIIERVTESTWAERERYWITRYGLGNLCNTRAGGGGGVPSVFHDGQSRTKTSFSISARGKRLLEKLARQMSTSRSGIIEMIIREEAEKRGITADDYK